jgi:hypothetical protein
MKRRAFLCSTVGSGCILTAGCLGSEEETYAVIQQFDLLNTREESTAIELRIEQSETAERIHDDRYELPPGFDGTALECVWPDEPLEIAIQRESDDSWDTLATTDYEECIRLVAHVSQQGTSYLTSQEACPIRSPDCHPDAGQ